LVIAVGDIPLFAFCSGLPLAFSAPSAVRWPLRGRSLSLTSFTEDFTLSSDQVPMGSKWAGSIPAAVVGAALLRAWRGKGGRGCGEEGREKGKEEELEV